MRRERDKQDCHVLPNIVNWEASPVSGTLRVPLDFDNGHRPASLPDRSRNTNSGTRSVPDTAASVEEATAGCQPAPPRYVTFINPHALSQTPKSRYGSELCANRSCSPAVLKSDGKPSHSKARPFVTCNWLGTSGRLGNQIFQIAATIGTARANGLDFTFPPWSYSAYRRFQNSKCVGNNSSRTWRPLCLRDGRFGKRRQAFALQMVRSSRPGNSTGSRRCPWPWC
jgi:hypothetical protein